MNSLIFSYQDLCKLARKGLLSLLLTTNHLSILPQELMTLVVDYTMETRRISVLQYRDLTPTDDPQRSIKPKWKDLFSEFSDEEWTIRDFAQILFPILNDENSVLFTSKETQEDLWNPVYREADLFMYQHPNHFLRYNAFQK